jgi:hypothetical protein
MLIRNIENDILQPMMEMVGSMIQQYGSDEMEYSITNAPPGIPKYGRVPLENLIGNYDYDFVAANYATGKVVKQRNLMAFYNIAMQSPYCNQPAFLKEIGKAMEIPFMNRLLKSEQQVQQEQQQAAQQAQQQGIIEKLLDMESKAVVAGIHRPDAAPGDKVDPITEHAHMVQKHVEDFLMASAGIPVEGTAPGPAGNAEGNQRESQFEGNIPGGNAQDQMRSFSQDMGANSLGTAGSGE